VRYWYIFLVLRIVSLITHQYQPNEQLPLSLIIEHKKEHDIYYWKSTSCFGTGTTNVKGLNQLLRPLHNWTPTVIRVLTIYVKNYTLASTETDHTPSQK